MAIEKGNWIKVSYKGTLKDGAVFDTSEGKEPLTFEAGAGTVIKGFDENVMGMNEGEEKEFTIEAKDAYGEESDANQEEVPISFFKDAEKIEPGMVFMAQSPMGPLKVKVLTVNGEKANVSVNHPLAGENLTFNIKVEKVLNEEEAKKHQEDMQKQQEAMKKAYEEMQKKQAEGKDDSCGPDDCAGCSGCK